MQKETHYTFDILYDDSESTEEEVIKNFEKLLIENGLVSDKPKKIKMNYWPIAPKGW